MKQSAAEKFRLRKDNRGATIVIVLVAMTFVTILAAVLLYMSLVNIQMKKADREGKRNFYDTEAVMNEIRAGLQEAASDAISEAYTEYLVNYNIDEEDKQGAFSDLFRAALLKYERGDDRLFSDDGDFYLVTVLDDFVTSSGADVRGNISDGLTYGAVTTDDSGVTLEGIEVTYVVDGYETTIRTDVKITVPSLYEMGDTIMTQVSLPEYAVIANETLTQPAGTGTITLTGNAYAGSVQLSGGGNVFGVRDAEYFISKGNVDVASGTTNFRADTSLWAKGIIIGDEGTIQVEGDANIRNDLQLNGHNSEAVLSGRYYGFGNSTDMADESSAIIVNGKQTVLDMSNLSALLLAGHSFINYYDSNILMGESVTVKTNQLAYLIPSECLTNDITNPMLFSYTPTVGELQGYIDYTQPVIGETALNNYVSDAQFIIQPKEGTSALVYFYMKFSSTDQANRYFKDYFEANREDIQKYLALYAEELRIDSVANYLDGNAVTYEQDVIDLIEATTVSDITTGKIRDRFLSLCVTLSPNGKALDYAGFNSPYDYYIDVNAVNALSGTEVIDFNGVPKVLVVDNPGSPFLIDDDVKFDTISLVIASGDVTVDRTLVFSGLIISGGSINLESSVKADRAAVNEAFEALVDHDTPANDYKYFNPAHLWPSGNDGGGGSDYDGRWDMEYIVTYENWTKN